MKKGDIIQTFGNPIKCETPLGQAKLIKKLGEFGKLEDWQVEYLDDEGRIYNILIKSSNYGKN